jgi:pimeloyl-ACP methyl ester carboxylesterase
MTIDRINGVQLFYEVTGTAGVPLVLVHGSWSSHDNWDLVVPGLADSCRVVAYDRRGHSGSERPAGQGSVHEDVADRAALIETLGLAPAFVAGNSFGAAIALKLAAARPDLLRGVVAHEPPLLPLLAGDPAFAPMLEDVSRRIGAVVERIARSDHAGAAEQFADTIALGPGSWARLPRETQQTMIENAPTFVDEMNDPEALAFDLAAVRRFDRPALLTIGTDSPPMFAPVLRKLAEALPRAEVLALPGVGHIPQVTHPALYVETVAGFVRRQAAA